MTVGLELGRPAPLGATLMAGGVNFALFSHHAEAVDLCLFTEDGAEERVRYPLSRTGDIWHGFVPGLEAGALYGFRVHGPYVPENGHRFNANKLLIDPYARALKGEWGPTRPLLGYDPDSPDADLSFCTIDSAPFMPKCQVLAPEARKAAKHPRTDWADTVIYEAHARGLTMLNGAVPKRLRGTVEALGHPTMITHLQEIGVTAVELLPVHQSFSEPRLTDMGLSNYWGYNSVNFFSLEPRYLGPKGAAGFRATVNRLHAAGIEVLLDVVYNHTAESWELGPTLSWRGIDNKSYYRLSPDNPRYYVNDTGTGNTLRTDHPAVVQMVLDSLRSMVLDYGVDGFRFDLGATLARTDAGVDMQAPLITALRQDPVLSGVKLIMEPWDIGNFGYQMGNFPAGMGEWNDRFRDDVRSYWRGDGDRKSSLAGALMGTSQVFDARHRSPYDSINFITSHDGFTLRDVVSYNERHNAANGEEGRDGHAHNLSDNCGTEGETEDLDILARRSRRQRALLATLLFSQGTPMLLAGDEFGHSQGGNNNAYCQDNAITWLDWAQADGDLVQVVAGLSRLRRTHACLRQGRYLHGVDEVRWWAPSGDALEGEAWHGDCPAFACQLMGDGEDLLILLNSGLGGLDFRLPGGAGWTCLFDSHDLHQPFPNSEVEGDIWALGAGSLCLLRHQKGAAAEP